jgi:hypothetical protein
VDRIVDPGGTMTTPNLNLPREQWPSHPHYPNQVLLVRSHDSFRRFSARLLELAEAGHDAESIGHNFRHLKSAMRGHEGYEEHKLYPYLEARWPLSCDPLRHGHERLAIAEAGVLVGVRDASGPASKALADALRHHDEVLGEHLDEEEDVVVPALLALTPEEFDAYYHGDITTLLATLNPS